MTNFPAACSRAIPLSYFHQRLNVATSAKRCLSRVPKSWRNRNHVEQHCLQVPDWIPRPPYAVSGVVEPSTASHPEVHGPEAVCHMRRSCNIAATVLKEVLTHVKVGVSTMDLERVALDAIVRQGAYPSPLHYRGFPAAICTSVNAVAVHGIPSTHPPLQKGDIVSVDVSVFFDGYHGDCAGSVAVGGVGGGERLLSAAEQCLRAAINVCRPGQDFCAIGNTIGRLARELGFCVVPAFCGHGIGTHFHCPPTIYHHENNEPGKMEKGMIFTIEPVLCEGRPDVVVLEDGWTAETEDRGRCAQFEHTLLITGEGAEVLTTCPA